MYDPIPSIDNVSSDLLLSIARKAFVRAGLCPSEWDFWWNDAAQVAILSLIETDGNPDGKRISRAKWCVFEFVINHIYGQMTGPNDLFDEDYELEDEWQGRELSFAENVIFELLPPIYAKVALALLEGKSNYEIAIDLGLKNEDSARAMVSKTRHKIKRILVEL